MAVCKMLTGGSGSIGGKVKFETGVPLTADTTVSCGFQPTSILVIVNCPNYSGGVQYEVSYAAGVDGNNQISYGSNSGATPAKYSVPYTSPSTLIKRITGDGFVFGYTSAVGNGVTIDYIATSEF